MKKYQSFLSEIFQFLEVKFSIYMYLNRRVFVLIYSDIAPHMFRLNLENFGYHVH